MTDPQRDLVFKRTVDLTPEQIWRGWTQPDILVKWFCPLPWVTTACEIDLRIGGKFHTVMQGPAGEVHDNTGSYLEIIPGRRLVWTNALLPDFRPAEIDSALGFAFTAIITLEPTGTGTIYTATVKHKDEADRQTHAAMGFEEGWGKALDQLVALMKSQAAA